MRASVPLRLLHFILAIAALTGVTFWARHYPMGWMWATPAIGAGITLFALRPTTALWLIPLLWPIIDQAPLTGWIHFPESDALILSAVAGVGLREAFASPNPHPEGSMLRPTPVALLLFAWIATSYLVSAWHADAPLPPFDMRLFAGYKTSLNAVRVLSGFILCVALLPTLHSAARIAGPDAPRHLAIGMCGGLAMASVAAVLERWQFTGLLNFASDYRTTAQFWEMHVGGAALDAWLALTCPFALWLFLSTRNIALRLAMLVVLGLAGYAILTTFSRGLYAAVVVSLPLMLWFMRMSASPHKGHESGANSGLGAGLIILALCVSTSASFVGGGYRGMGALLGFAWLAYLSTGYPTRLTGRSAIVTMIAGALAGLLAFPLMLLPKGVYAYFVLLWTGGLIATVLTWRTASLRMVHISLAVTSATGIAAAGVGLYWGEGNGAIGIMTAVGIILLALTIQHTGRPFWHTDRDQAVAALLVFGLAGALAVGVGSYYLGERFGSVERDLEGRMDHWRAGVALVPEGNTVWGLGLGRYPDAYFWSGPLSDTASAWLLEREDGNVFSRLAPARKPLGHEEVLRVSQRIDSDAIPPFLYRLRVRSDDDVYLQLEVCRKHLLYAFECLQSGHTVPPGPWTMIEIRSPEAGSGHQADSRPLVFSMFAYGKSVIDVDDIEIIDGRGQRVERNGDFQAGADDWFFSSDRIHLPWHAKNLGVHVWVEQGWVGLLGITMAYLAGLARMTVGPGRRHPLSAPLAAGMLGFLIVGAFDSLLDMPRMTLMCFTGIWLMLTLQSRPGHAATRRRPRRSA